MNTKSQSDILNELFLSFYDDGTGNVLEYIKPHEAKIKQLASVFSTINATELSKDIDDYKFQIAAMDDALEISDAKYIELNSKNNSLSNGNFNLLKKLSQLKEKANAVISAQNDYNELLISELGSLVSLAAIHGWKSKNVEEGQILRDRLNKAVSEYEQHKNKEANVLGMTAEEVENGNIIISRFMELHQVQFDEPAWISPTADKNFSQDLRYHSSWDWLMTAVEKLERLGFEIRIETWWGVNKALETKQPQANVSISRKHQGLYNFVKQERGCSSKIEAVFMIVIRAIQKINSEL